LLRTGIVIPAVGRTNTFDGRALEVGIGLIFAPPFDPQPHGVLATHGPRRPNPTGLSVVAFDGFERPDTLLIDIKPYLPTTDSAPDVTMGWLAPHATPRRG
jgi:tRNA (Thr-GGU) A37 N-methylase